MAISRTCARLGVTTLALGLTVMAPHAAGIAYADTPDTDASTRASAVRSSSTDRPSEGGTRTALAETGRVATPGPSRGITDVVGADSHRRAAVSAAASTPNRSQSALPPVPAGSKVVSPPAGATTSVSTARVSVVPVSDNELRRSRPAIAAAVPSQIGAAGASRASASAAAAWPAATVNAPVLGALNTAVSNWFDSTANWLADLPGSPVRDVLSGGLLLLRRNLFNQVPTAKPDMYSMLSTGQTAGTEYIGTIGAVDPEGDGLIYSLVETPQFGAVQISADGTYDYVAGPDYAGSDAFTVAISNPGFNILDPLSLRQTLVSVNVPCARGGGPGAAAASGTGGGCNATSLSHFDIYNFTGQVLMVNGVQTMDSAHTNPVQPTPGTLVHPGEYVELELGTRWDTTVTFAVPGTGGQKWDVVANVPGVRGYAPYANCTVGDCIKSPKQGFTDTKGPKYVFLVDAPGTTWDFTPADFTSGQTLNDLVKAREALGEKSPLQFQYDNAIYTTAPSDYALLGNIIRNMSSIESAEVSRTATLTVGTTKTSGWQFDAGVDLAITKIVSASFGAHYTTDVSQVEERTYTSTVSLKPAPYSFNAFYEAKPLINVTGDIGAVFKACGASSSACVGTTPDVKFNFHDVDYTYPNPNTSSAFLQPFSGPSQDYPNQGFRVEDAARATDKTYPLSPTYNVGDKRQLLVRAYLGTTVATPDDLTGDPQTKYTSSDESVATVSTSGGLTALMPGTTRITTTYAWVAPDGTKGSVESYMDVTVVN